MSESSARERWRKIVETLDAAGLDHLAAYVRDESNAAHAAPLSIPIIGETGSGKSALVARIFGVEPATFPIDVLESTARPVEVKYARTNYRAVVHGDSEEWEECEDDARWDALVRGQDPLSSGSRLEVGLQREDLATWNASIVDTPGMNTNTPELEGRAWAAAATAPVVILAIPATSTGRRTDIDYLESLGDNSASVVIALTKADQLPQDSVDRVIDDFRNRLAERGISPLEILPTSSTEGKGIEKLRQVLTEVTGMRRDQLIAHHVGGRVVAKIQSELSALRLKQTALESEALTIRERGEIEERDIDEERADQEADLTNTTNTLKDRCKRLRLEAFNRMHEIGKAVLQTISEEIAPLQTRDQVQHFADSSVRRCVLQWREKCIAVAEGRLEELDQAGVQTAKEMASQHFDQIGLATDWLQELPEGTVSPAWDSASVDDLQNFRAELEGEIEELKKQKHAPAEELEDIQQALSVTQTERDKLVYVPQMDKVRLDQGAGEFREGGRILGKIADVALTLSPIPTGGKVGVFLKNLPKGGQIISGIKKYNGLIAARDKRLLNAVSSTTHLSKPLQTKLPATPGRRMTTDVARGWLMKAIDNLSLETWGERLGGAVGNWISPDKVVEIENEEVRQEFLKRTKPFEDEIHKLRYEQTKIKSRQNEIDRKLEEKIVELERRKQLEKESEELTTRQQRLEAEEQATKAKTALMAQLTRQFLAHDGDSLCADIRKAVGAGFASADEALENHLRERVSAIKSEVQAALKEARAKHAEGEAAVKKALEENQKMRSALESALSQQETL